MMVSTEDIEEKNQRFNSSTWKSWLVEDDRFGVRYF